jgi:putative ABC transport system permease protein
MCVWHFFSRMHIMLKNYFKTALRNLARSKSHSLINITGLSIGMAVALLIGLWMYDEISFDHHFTNYNRIAQVIQNVTNNGTVETWTSVPFPLAEELRKNYGSGFSHVVMCRVDNHLVTVGDNKLKKQGGFFEPGAAEMFSLKMLRGNWKGLDDPSSIFLSESMAKAYFGNADPVNKIVKIDDLPVVKVTGVYQDFPRNSSFADLQFMSPWALFYNDATWLKTIEDPWRPNFVTLYVQLADHEDLARVGHLIKDAKLKKVNAHLAAKKPELLLQPMSNWHLYSQFKDGVNVGGAIQYVWMFGTIGLFVLLLACINFMNLSTAQSEKRAKEVGIRKTLGSLRRQLIIQFFNESLLTVVFAFALSLAFVSLALPFFNEVADKQMSILWNNSMFWLLSILFILFTALIAGSYPAFYLSSFKPIKVLKGTFKAGRLAAAPRKILVVLQFTVSVALIIGTIIVYRQIQFAKDRPVGYNRNRLITIPTMNGSIHKHFEAVKDELLRTGAISSITEAGSPTTDFSNSTSGLSWQGKDPNLSIDFSVSDITYDYGQTLNWQIKEGRNFSKAYATDSSALLLNEAAVKFIGLKKTVGAIMSWWGHPVTVIGVVKDMVVGSPYDQAVPTIYSLMGPNDAGNDVIVRVNPSVSTKEALSKITPVFRQFNPDQPFEYNFVDEEYARKFSNEERVGRLASFFALLAVVISCLGLFGLMSFVAEQRKKEIGIRKVLGASVFNVWHLLSRDFVMLVVISFLISIPLSWFFMHGWLQNYHYRAALSWWIFLAAGAGALAITMAVVSFQAIKAALTNPVRSLRAD